MDEAAESHAGIPERQAWPPCRFTLAWVKPCARQRSANPLACSGSSREWPSPFRPLGVRKGSPDLAAQVDRCYRIVARERFRHKAASTIAIPTMDSPI